MAQFKPLNEMTDAEIQAELAMLSGSAVPSQTEVQVPKATTVPTTPTEMPLEAPVSLSEETSPTTGLDVPSQVKSPSQMTDEELEAELASLGPSTTQVLEPIEGEEDTTFLEEAGEVVEDIAVGTAIGARQGLIEFANIIKPLYGLDPEEDTLVKEYTTPDSISGELSKTVSKFATGYGLTAPLRGVGAAAKLKGGAATLFEGAVRSGLGDYIVANADDETFASYMADHGSDNPLVLALAVNPEDDESTRKLKVAAEGLVFTGAIAGIGAGLSKIKGKYLPGKDAADEIVPSDKPINTITDISDDANDLVSEAVPEKLSQANRTEVIHENIVDKVIAERLGNLEEASKNLEEVAGVAEVANKTPLIKMAITDIKDLNKVRDGLAEEIDTVQKQMDDFTLPERTSNEFISLLNEREALKSQLANTLDSIDEYRFSIGELDTTSEAYREAMKARMSMGLVQSDSLDRAIYKGNAPTTTGRDIFTMLEKEKEISKPLHRLADPDLPTKEADLIIDDLVKGRRSRSGFKKAVGAIASNTVGRATDAFNSLADSSRTAAKFANLLRHDSYKFGKNAGNWSYRETVQSTAGKFKARYKDALENHLPKSAWTRGGDLKPEVNDYLVRYLRGDTAVDSPYRKAAMHLRSVLDDFVDMAKEFDPNTGKLEHFFPRRYQIGEGIFGGSKQNTKEDFIRYLNSKGIQDEARIEDIMQKIANENDEYLGIFLKDSFETDLGYRGSRTIGGGRTLTELDDLDMEQFLDNDLVRVLDSYFELGSRKITYHNMFGIDGSKARGMLDQINRELKGKNVQAITVEEEQAFKDILKHIQGTDKLKNAILHGSNEALATLTRMATLGATFLTSLVEAALIPAKVGVRHAAKGFAVAATDGAQNVVSKFVKGVPKSEAYKAAHRVDLGLDFAASQRLDALYGGEAITGINRKANETFFKATFLHQWVQYLQVASHHATSSLITDNLETLAKGVKNKSKAQFLRKELDSLGVDVDAGIEWVNKGKPKKDPFTEQIDRGALRATNDVVINPDPTVKPFYMNNPTFKLITLLKNYPLAFPNTVLRDWYQRTVAADNNYERIVNTSRILSSMLVSYGLWEVSQTLKDEIFYGGDRPKKGWTETPEERFLNFMDTSGYLGVFGFIKHAMDAEKYGKTPLEGLFGPGYQTLTAISELGVALANGDSHKAREITIKGLIEKSPQPLASEIPLRLVFDQGSKQFRKQLSGHLVGKDLEYTESEPTLPEVTEPDVPSNPILDKFPGLQNVPQIFNNADAGIIPVAAGYIVRDPAIFGGTATKLPDTVDGVSIPGEDMVAATINSGGDIDPFTGEPLFAMSMDEVPPGLRQSEMNDMGSENLDDLLPGTSATEEVTSTRELPPGTRAEEVPQLDLTQELDTLASEVESKGTELVQEETVANPFELYDEARQVSIDEGTHKNKKGEHIAYIDTEGHLTGGIGHLMSTSEREQYPEGTPIPSEVVDAWFKEDMAEATRDAEALISERGITGLPEDARNILVNMTFNLGKSRLSKFKKMWKALEEGDYETAGDEMHDSKWRKQVKSRATRLISRMKSLTEEA